MGHTSNKITIRVQLTVAMFLATLVMLLITSVLLVYYKTEDLKQSHAREARTIAAILSQDFIRVILLSDADVTIDMVKKVEAFEGIAHASILNKKNIPILTYTRPGYSVIDFMRIDISQYSADNNLYYITIPITYNGRAYGDAHFYFQNQTFNKEFALFLNRMWYIVPLLLLLSIIIALISQRFFTRPIRELAYAVEQMENQNTILLDKRRANSKEMTSLFSGFQNMAKNIEKTQASLAEKKERLHIMLESIADGVIATDSNGIVMYMNPAAEHITLWPEADAINLPANEVYFIMSERSDFLADAVIDETIMTGIVHFSLDDTILKTRDGENIPIKSTISPIRDQHGAIIGTIIIFQNVSESRTLANKLRYQASHDALTNLVNRAEFENQLIALIPTIGDESSHALLYLDLDQFKIINDTSGHTAGDALLKQMSTLLHEDVREHDTVARLGGDEFAVLLKHCTTEKASFIAEKIRERITDFTFIWEGKQFKVGVSIGVVPIQDSLRTADDLLRDADLACYAAKDGGRNRVHVYCVEDKLLEQRHGEMNWVTRIREAIEQDHLVLYAQHVRALDQRTTAHHFEVLVRYRDENGVLILPGNFLPAVERYGLAPDLDRWVIRNVLTDKNIITQVKKNNNLHVNINLSGHTLSDPSLIPYVEDMLQQAELPPRTICFEITETAAVANLAATAHFMRKMKLLGCEFALDDFGIGVSSFAYLKNLPVDYLKIDGCFVQDIDSNLINRAMVTAINEIGHVMNIKTVAEFVSNSSICEVLRDLEVDFVQGFFVHRPCPIGEVFQHIEAPGALICG